MALRAVEQSPVKRKLTAILAADVAGYSRLMGADEEGTLARLKAHRRDLIDPKIGEHGGHVVKTTGDGILIEFPSVVEAVRCAIEVQSGIAERNAELPRDTRIEFRVGINLGDVIVEEGDIYGDGVNIAARLEALAEPGGVLISRAAYEQVKNKLVFDYRFLGEQRVKNIADPVPVYRVCASRSTPGKHRGAARTWRRRKIPALAAIVLAVVAATIAAAALWYRHDAAREATMAGSPSGTGVAQSAVSLPLPDKPSLAVLPFVNMGHDAADESFTDGLMEDVVAELSRLQDLFVIARDTTAIFKGKAVDVQEVGRQLGVRYVLEGSVQRDGNRVRVTAQLIDAGAGRHIWAERYDRTMDSIFAVQEDLTTNIVGVLLSKVRATEVAAAFKKPTTDLRAYDLVKQSIRYRNTFTREANLRGREVLERAIQLDPS